METEIKFYKGTENGKDINEKGVYLARGGLYKFNNNLLFSSITKIDEVKELMPIEERLVYKIEKMPNSILNQIIGFFKQVYKEHNAESIVLLYYNFDSKEFKVEVPDQKVAGASLSYGETPIIENFTLIGSIHSHGNMSAFHSGTDDKDELDWNGLHVTIGNVDEERPSFACRLISEKREFKINISQIVDMPKEETSFPTEWLNKVTKKEYTQVYPGWNMKDYEYDKCIEKLIRDEKKKSKKKSKKEKYKQHLLQQMKVPKITVIDSKIIYD